MRPSRQRVSRRDADRRQRNDREHDLHGDDQHGAELEFLPRAVYPWWSSLRATKCRATARRTNWWRRRDHQPDVDDDSVIVPISGPLQARRQFTLASRDRAIERVTGEHRRDDDQLRSPVIAIAEASEWSYCSNAASYLRWRSPASGRPGTSNTADGNSTPAECGQAHRQSRREQQQINVPELRLGAHPASRRRATADRCR